MKQALDSWWSTFSIFVIFSSLYSHWTDVQSGFFISSALGEQTLENCHQITIHSQFDASRFRLVRVLWNLMPTILSRKINNITRAPSRHVANWNPLPITRRLFCLYNSSAKDWISSSSFRTFLIRSMNKNYIGLTQKISNTQFQCLGHKIWKPSPCLVAPVGA